MIRMVIASNTWLLTCLWLQAEEPRRVPPLPESVPSIPMVIQTGSACPTPCPGKCCQEECVVCVPEVKKHTKTVYTTKPKYVCLEKCSLFSWFKGNGCDACATGCGECGKVRKVNQLVKKVKPDCDTLHCVPKVLTPCENKPQ